jgi:hypothetical protein
LLRATGTVIGELGVQSTKHGVALDWEIYEPDNRPR